ncbi:hypothetical protein BHM03_00005580 [Ensete ventricosum]|nr:hypothetical protein BHM03_00005580 [Ensete ventricosum]
MAAAWVGFRRLFAISAVSSPPLATAVPASESGFRRLFSISAFSPSLPAAAPPAAEPSTNLFVSGKTPCHFAQTTPTRTNTASDSSSTTSTGNGASGYQ